MAYRCNCGREFPTPTDRLLHSATCHVMKAYEERDRFRRALREIADFAHHPDCTTKMVPVYECCCYLKDQARIAREALGDIVPIFICSKCGVIENTALSNYWTRDYLQGSNAPPLCSACDPAIGKWHDSFERKKMPEDHVVGPDGFVYHQDDSYLKRLLKETAKKR